PYSSTNVDIQGLLSNSTTETAPGASGPGVVNIPITATALLQRSVANSSLTAGSVSSGRVLLANSATSTTLSTPNTAAADDNHATRLDLADSSSSVTLSGI